MAKEAEKYLRIEETVNENGERVQTVSSKGFTNFELVGICETYRVKFLVDASNTINKPKE